MVGLFGFTQTILLITHVILSIFTAYLVLLTIAAYRAPKKPYKQLAKLTNFAFLIPAHNEESLLPELLESILKLDYPHSHFKIHVIADNCTDKTADIAAAYGANVHRRFNTDLIGKGYALQWALDEIRQADLQYDAFVVIDADSTISANFLKVMNEYVVGGAKVIQAYYTIEEPQLSWNIGLRYAAFAVLHFLRPQGRMTLGGSAGLKGNGMVFTPDILSQFPWPVSITEDIEYHMILLLNGFPVKFAPDALVWTEMPIRFEQSHTQIERWEYGRLEMARKYVLPLIKAAAGAVKQKQPGRAFYLFDAAMEHLIPPFSLMFGGAVLLLFVDSLFILGVLQFPLLSRIISISWANLSLGVFLIGGQIYYLLAGLRLARAPKSIYRQLLFSPIFMLRKVGRYFRILGGNKPHGWVKTVRN